MLHFEVRNVGLMYLLDTDTLTHLYAGQPNVVERFSDRIT
jgi:hypothetical protein